MVFFEGVDDDGEVVTDLLFWWWWGMASSGILELLERDCSFG